MRMQTAKCTKFQSQWKLQWTIPHRASFIGTELEAAIPVLGEDEGDGMRRRMICVLHRVDQQDQEGYVQDTVGVRDAMQKWFCIPRSKVKLSAAVPGCSHLWSILGYCKVLATWHTPDFSVL